VRRLYVESNFVLELVLSQKHSAECEQLLVAAESESVELAIPSYCLGEPLETIGRRHRERRRLQEGVQTELRQLRRNREYREAIHEARDITNLFARSAQEDADRIEHFYRRLARAADLVAMTSDVAERAFELSSEYDLQLQDAFVLSTIVVHLSEHPAESAFVTTNSKDFDDPDLRGDLEALGCRLLTGFGEALGFAVHQT
jgi:predicted nucleic acid-binding protein